MSDKVELSLVASKGRETAFVIARLVLGIVFIWMGLTKTGLVSNFLNTTGLSETAAVQRIVQSGAIELSNPVDFLKLIREYQMIPESMPVVMNFVAAVLPWLELWCGVLLVLGLGVRGVAFMIVSLMAAFTVMVTIRALHIYNTQDIAFCDIKFDCGCGAGVVYICRKIPENLFLLACSIGLLFSRSCRFCLRRELIATNNKKPTSIAA
jgi:uncharacterized membrane protein YphA (DoxX/SURF4 family)